MSRAADVLQPVLATLAGDPASPFGVPGAGVEVLRRIDGPFSTVYRVRVDGPGAPRHVYIKIMNPRGEGEEERARVDRMLAREYRATRRLYDALRQDEAMGALRPLALLPDHRAIVTEEVPGRPFSDLLVEGRRGPEALAAVAAAVGRWIRIYQNLEPGTPGTAIELAEGRRYVDDRLRLLEGRVLAPGDRLAALARFDALSRGIGTAVTAVSIHADLTPANVVVDDNGRMTVLDFTMAKTGTTLHDLTHFYFHLELMGARHRRRLAALRIVQAALLAGYAPTCNPHDPLFRLMMLQHGVCHVAQLAERRVPIVDRAYRWFLKQRWRFCERLAAGADARQAV